MLLQMFKVLQKNLFTKESVEQSHKIKEFNKLIYKTVTLHCYCGVHVKYGFLSKTFVSMKATIRFYDK